MDNVFESSTKKLGFGLMRLPETTKSSEFGNIDIGTVGIGLGVHILP